MEESMIKRIMPNSLEAEQSVIGSMIMDRDAIVTATEMLHKDDFYHKQYGVLFEAMSELFMANLPVDLVTLQNKLKEKDVPSEISSLEFVRDLLNAVPTCEGAIQIAMEELPITIYGANVVVTGFGKIGELLALMLKNMGANVTVCARRSAQRAKALIHSLHAAPFSYLGECMASADIVFNTVPQQVIKREHLMGAKDTLIIDLASKPGGVDMDGARDLGVKVIWALGLPGKVAPVTAGNIIKETICNIISESGE